MASTKKKTIKKAPATMKSFVRAKNTQPFFKFKATQQTVYWLIIGILVLSIGIWMTVLTIQLQRIYDQVETQNSIYEPVVKPKAHN